MTKLQETGVELIAKGADTYIDAMGRARDANGRFVAGAQDAESKTGGSGGSFSMIGMAAANFIGTMAVQAFNAAKDAAAEFVVSTITTAADYETTMNRFASVTGNAVADAGMSLDEFNQLFLDMGAKTQFSAQEAAQAAVELAKGGLDPATIAAGGLEGALALAAAGELELAQAAEITAKTLGVWGDTGVDAAMAADLLSQAANASTVNVDDLAIGLANVGGTAKVAGVGFNDTVQALALLAPGFSSASDAGTSLKTFISRLIPTTDKQTEAMIDLGLATEDGKSAFFDAQGEFIGMRRASQLLQDATEGLSEEQKLLALNTIFGQDAIRAAAYLAEAGAEGFDAMGESMGDAGTAAEQAAERNKGLNFALESLKGSWETIQIVIGTALLPILTDLLNTAIIPLANNVLSFAQTAMPKLTEALSGAQGQIQPFLDTVTNIATFLLNVGTNSDTAREALANIPEPIQPIIDAAGNLKTAWDENMPMVLTYINDMKSSVDGLAESVGKVFGEKLESTLNTAAEFWRNHGEEVMQVANFLWRTLVAVVGIALIILITAIDIGVKVMTGIWSTGAAIMKGDWETALNEINTTADTSFDSLMVSVADTIDLLIQTFSGGEQQLDEDWRKSLENLGTNLQNAQTVLNVKAAQLITGIVDSAKAAAAGFVGVGEQIIRGMVQGIQNLAGMLGQEAANAALGALAGAKAALGIHSPSTAFEEQVGEMAGEGFIAGLQNMAGQMARAASNIFGGTVGDASQAARASMQSPGYSYSNSRNFNLTLNTQQSTGSVLRDFGVMQLLAG
jgi:TP901 family phage tail tape measure protein